MSAFKYEIILIHFLMWFIIQRWFIQMWFIIQRVMLKSCSIMFYAVLNKNNTLFLGE